MTKKGDEPRIPNDNSRIRMTNDHVEVDGFKQIRGVPRFNSRDLFLCLEIPDRDVLGVLELKLVGD